MQANFSLQREVHDQLLRATNQHDRARADAAGADRRFGGDAVGRFASAAGGDGRHRKGCEPAQSGRADRARRSRARSGEEPVTRAICRSRIASRGTLRDRIGVCQWFHFEDYAAVERAVELMHELKIRHLRTGISWADFYRPGGKKWYDWQMQQLADFDLLLSVWHTPPSISEGNVCNSPPKRLRNFADFIDTIITEYAGAFGALELWNEPNNRYKWDFEHYDPGWQKFAEMIGAAAYWAKQRGQTTVLGGMIPVDHHWLNLMKWRGVLDWIDVVAIHAFP